MSTSPERPLALITGAAGDIGSAVARRLAAEHRLALVDHPSRSAVLDALADELGGAGHTDTWTDTFDVTDEQQTRSAVGRCVAGVGVPSALVNNAGVQGAFAPVHEYPLADAATVITVNLIGAFNVLVAVSAEMVAAGRHGAVVNLASMAGVAGAANMGAYSASKAGVIGMTRSAAKDLAPHGIRVNSVSPAFIGPGEMWDRQVRLQAGTNTQYFSTDPDEVAAAMIASVPLRRCGTLGEVADVVAYLLSSGASYLTGIDVEIAGGAG